MSTNPDDDLIRKFYASLLNNSPNGLDPSATGRWVEAAEAMLTAFQNGGVSGLTKVMPALISDTPDLGVVLASAKQTTRQIKTEWEVDELLDAEFPPLRWIVPNILPEGLTFLAGRPKVGKSFLALQIACSVANGGRVFGEPVERMPVLYIALEDGPRRLQRRLKSIGWRKGTQSKIKTSCENLDLQSEINQHGYRFIVLDTLSRYLRNTRDQNDIGEMTDAAGELQRIAIDNGISILLIDHHTKPKGTDPNPVDDILGSTGKAAVADCLMGLYRQRGKKGATLAITGRDLEDKKLALEWDSTTQCWQLLGDAEQVESDSVQGAIIRMMEELGGETTISEVADCLGRDRGNIAREMSELVARGIVKRGQKAGKKVPYLLVTRIQSSQSSQSFDQE